jgi:hypothetical protein
MEGLVGPLDISELYANQRIKLLQIALQYTLPRLQAMIVKDQKEEPSLFVEYIVVWKRKEDSNEENWQDKFESKSLLKK